VVIEEKPNKEDSDPWVKKYLEPSDTAKKRIKQIENNKNKEEAFGCLSVVGAAIWGGIMGFFGFKNDK